MNVLLFTAFINKYILSKSDDRGYSAERPYTRKVRAPQGRVPGNSRSRRLEGKCNRNKPPYGYP